MLKTIFLLLSAAASLAAQPANVSVSPSSGIGSSQTFAFTYFDGAGGTDLEGLWAQISPSLSWAHDCVINAHRSTNTLYLLTDDASTWIGPLTIGSPGTLTNSQCTLDAGHSGLSVSGNYVTLNVMVTFNPGYSGAMNSYLVAYTAGMAWNSWQPLGRWTVPSASGTAVNVNVSPSSGIGPSQTFSFGYSDASGANDLEGLLASISTSWAPWSHTCLIDAHRSTNSIYLLMDDGSGWLGPMTMGTAGAVLQNSECTVDVRNSAIVTNGNILVLAVAVSFAATYTGLMNTYEQAYTAATVWNTPTQVGTWEAQAAVMQTSINQMYYPETQPVPDDYTGGTITLNNLQRRFKSSHGSIEIRRADNINVGQVKYEKPTEANGEYTYRFSFDNSQVEMVRLGEFEQRDLHPIASTQPEGWYGAGTGWSPNPLKTPSRARSAAYTMTSKLRPGVIPLHLAGEGVGQFAGPEHMSAVEVEFAARRSGIFNNSQRVYVIGPLFPEDATKEEVMEAVKMWKDGYGMEFLQPLIDGGTLADLKPSTQLERDTVEALKIVLP